MKSGQKSGITIRRALIAMQPSTSDEARAAAIARIRALREREWDLRRIELERSASMDAIMQPNVRLQADERRQLAEQASEAFAAKYAAYQAASQRALAIGSPPKTSDRGGRTISFNEPSFQRIAVHDAVAQQQQPPHAVQQDTNGASSVPAPVAPPPLTPKGILASSHSRPASAAATTNSSASSVPRRLPAHYDGRPSAEERKTPGPQPCHGCAATTPAATSGATSAASSMATKTTAPGSAASATSAHCAACASTSAIASSAAAPSIISARQKSWRSSLRVYPCATSSPVFAAAAAALSTVPPTAEQLANQRRVAADSAKRLQRLQSRTAERERPGREPLLSGKRDSHAASVEALAAKKATAQGVREAKRVYSQQQRAQSAARRDASARHQEATQQQQMQPQMQTRVRMQPKTQQAAARTGPSSSSWSAESSTIRNGEGTAPRAEKEEDVDDFAKVMAQAADAEDLVMRLLESATGSRPSSQPPSQPPSRPSSQPPSRPSSQPTSRHATPSKTRDSLSHSPRDSPPSSPRPALHPAPVHSAPQPAPDLFAPRLTPSQPSAHSARPAASDTLYGTNIRDAIRSGARAGGLNDGLEMLRERTHVAVVAATASWSGGSGGGGGRRGSREDGSADAGGLTNPSSSRHGSAERRRYSDASSACSSGGGALSSPPSSSPASSPPRSAGPRTIPRDLHGRAIPGYDTDGVAIGSYSPPHTAELRNKGKREGEDEEAVAPAPAYRGAASYRAAHPTDQPLVYGRRLSQAKEAKQSEEEALLAAARRKDKDALDALRSMSPEGKSRSPPLLRELAFEVEELGRSPGLRPGKPLRDPPEYSPPDSPAASPVKDVEAPSPSPPPSGSPTYGFVHHEEDEEEGEVSPSTAEKLDLAEVRELLKLPSAARAKALKDMPTPKLRTAMYDTQSLPLRKYIAGLLEARGATV